MNVCFETFGCRLNQAEALQQEADAIAAGHRIVENHAEANLIVIRGCSVTARAQRDCEKLIEHLRAKYPMKELVLTGCLPNRTTGFFIKPSATAVPTRTARAYLKVQDGCAGGCTFCTVPRFRGPSTSVDFDQVLTKARAFIATGYHEIVVTGCNLSLYASQGKQLPELLSSLAELDPGCRIRLGSLEPSAVANEIPEIMAQHPNICRFLHLPVQSGSPNILKAMRRPHTVADAEALVIHARKLMPEIAIGCDLMTGFPGETELDALATKGLLTRLNFCKAHVFPYSERPGTLASQLLGIVPRTIRHARARELIKVANELRSDYAKSFIGKTVEIVVEDEKKCAGWTSERLWCECRGGQAARKTMTRVRVFSTDGHRLLGGPVR